jgi:DNA repair exonuclease SbcCD nuclease subunit
MNSRLADAVSIIKQVQSVALKVDADLVLFGGDMFHVRRHIAVRAFNAVYEAMAEFALEKIPIVMIHGNHDQADKQGADYSIYAFRTFCTVIGEPGWHEVVSKGGPLVQLCAVPYMENIEHLRDVISSRKGRSRCAPMAHEPVLFLGHLGIQGAKIGADFVYVNPHDAAITDLSMDIFDAGFLGHYHEHQQLPASGNFWYIGAPMHHSWGDREDTGRGCIVYDTDSKSFERVRLQAPEFIQVHEKDTVSRGAVNMRLKDSYLRVVSDRVWSDDEREDLCQRVKARSVEVMQPAVGVQKTATPRLQIQPGSSYQDLVERYVRSGLAPAEDLDPDYLTALGREILEEIEE